MNTELFIKATRIKLRFNSKRGMLSLEDLWDLPLTSNTGQVNLNDLAINTYNGLQTQSTVSFVDTAKTEESIDTLRLEILKYVITVKHKENLESRNAAAKSEEKRKLLSLLQQKQEDKLSALSEEDLIARIEAL